jgi:DNA repair photolyase
MLTCGSQIILCDCPLRMDVYQGCSHQCEYCFARRKDRDRNEQIKIVGSRDELTRFLDHDGKAQFWNHGLSLNWIDFNVPIHLGGTSDPFQPCESTHKITLDLISEFERTQYPLIISTKGRLVAEPDYLSVLSKCRVVIQISMACPEYDAMESGAPGFLERLDMVERIIRTTGRRTLARVQPYFPNYFQGIKDQLSRLSKAGIHGIILEGYKGLSRDDPRLIKFMGDMVYPLNILRPQFEELRETAHALGMRFYCGENRLRWMSDDLCCCGCDGLEGFEPNNFNLNHIFYDDKRPTPSNAQETVGTGDVFAAITQDAVTYYMVQPLSFAELMNACAASQRGQEMLGVINSEEQGLLF